MNIPEIAEGINHFYIGIDPITPTLFTIEGEIMLVYHSGGKAKLLFFNTDYTYSIFNFE